MWAMFAFSEDRGEYEIQFVGLFPQFTNSIPPRGNGSRQHS